MKNPPVDVVRIDGQFTRDMARSINEAGQVKNFRTIAEFVENQEH